jgi:hypothetical protein
MAANYVHTGHTKRWKKFQQPGVPPPPFPLFTQLKLQVSVGGGKNALIYYSVKTDDVAFFCRGGGGFTHREGGKSMGWFEVSLASYVYIQP